MHQMTNVIMATSNQNLDIRTFDFEGAELH